MNLAEALDLIGRDPEARAAIVAALLDFENRSDHGDLNLRDEVTGPVVDALHTSAGTLCKRLSDGLAFEFLYRSKIARDFVMSRPETPDHVWEPQTTRLLLKLASTAKHAIVAGAYFGDQAVPIAAALRERGHCHAFEPDPVQASMLRRNAELNRLHNLHVHVAALWSDSRSRIGLVGEDALARPVVSGDGAASTTIDELVAAETLPSVDLLALDVEGGELAILRGGELALRTCRPHVVFEIHGAYTDWSGGLAETAIVHYLAGLGYSILAIRDYQSNVDMGRRPIELVPLESACLEGPSHGFNLVAVADRSILSGEAFRIVSDVSPKLLRHRRVPLHQPCGEG